MEKTGYDANFVDELPDYLICVICQLALRNPVLLVNCGHRLCSPCFKTMKEHAARQNAKLLCPHDRIKVDANKVVEDKGTSRLVLDLQVKCNREGCQWSGELRNLTDHLKGDCSAQEKEKMFVLMKQLEGRVEACEIRLAEKDKEINLLKQQVQQYSKQSFEKNTASTSGLQCTGLTDTKLNKQIKQRSSLMQEDVEFKWKIKNYSHKKETCSEINSPKFFSGENGHCCMLNIEWCGKNKGRVEITFYIVAANNNKKVKTEPFWKRTKIHLVDINGICLSSEITPFDIATNQQAFEIGRNMDISPGYVFEFGDDEGCLNMPRFGDFIICNTLLITCIMTPY